MHIYVLRGRSGRWLLWIVFTLLSVAFLANLASYVSGAAEIVADLTGIAQRLAELLVYVISAMVVFFGLRAVGIAERIGVLVLVGLIAVIGIGAIGIPFHAALGPSGSARQWMALYGMVMYALWTFYSVPQVVKGLGHGSKDAVRAILRSLCLLVTRQYVDRQSGDCTVATLLRNDMLEGMLQDKRVFTDEGL
jgi:amino acid permease